MNAAEMVYGRDYWGFVYAWRDRTTKWVGIGSHYGAMDDGYTSRTGWLHQAIRKRPRDFRRRILFVLTVDDREALLAAEQHWLDLIPLNELATAENMRLGTAHYFNAKQFASGGAWNKGRIGVQQYPRKVCEHCGEAFSYGMYAAWHGDMCLNNPQITLAAIHARSRKKFARQPPEIAAHLNALQKNKQCSVCGLTTSRGNIARWHEQNCRPRRQRSDVRARARLSPTALLATSIHAEAAVAAFIEKYAPQGRIT